jgi:DNA-binding IclR family transcriptional regulator
LIEGDLRLEDVSDLLGVEADAAQRILKLLQEDGVANPTSMGGRYALGLPIRFAERITPGLFP